MERVIPNGTTNTARMHDAKIRQAMSARKAKTRRVKDMEAPRWKLTVSNSCRVGSRRLTGPARANGATSWQWKQEGKKIVAIGFALFVFCEVLQYLTGCGMADVNDVLFNTLGAAVGVWLARRIA